MSMYERIGETNIAAIITEFYKRAFEDPIIGHFFHNKDREDITKKQIDFVVNMLGGPKRYEGKPLEVAHREFTIREAHFDRRQMIMKEVMQEFGVDKIAIHEWLLLESNFRKLIVTVLSAVNKKREAEAASDA